MISSRLLQQLSTTRRCIGTSSRANFRFKLTDEMAEDWAQQDRAKKAAKTPKEQATHTRESSLIMGRVSHDRQNRVVKIGVPKHRLNEYYLLYIREQDNIYAYDELDQCDPGDWVLLRQMKASTDEKVSHKVEKIVYKYGKYVDPLTGRRAFGLYYDDDLKKLEQIKLEL